MAATRLTNEQRDDAANKIELATSMAKRLRVPPGYSREEWDSEVLLVLVESVATAHLNDNFEAHFYMRCKFRQMQIAKRFRTTSALVLDIAQRPEPSHTLADVLEGLRPIDSDIVRLRLAGGNWETIGQAYGWCGRTARRRYSAAVAKLKAQAPSM